MVSYISKQNNCRKVNKANEKLCVADSNIMVLVSAMESEALT